MTTAKITLSTMMMLVAGVGAVGVKAWMVENRVIKLERQVELVANLGLATGESVNRLLAQEISQLQASQMQIEVYEEEQPASMEWLQL